AAQGTARLDQLSGRNSRGSTGKRPRRRASLLHPGFSALAKAISYLDGGIARPPFGRTPNAGAATGKVAQLGVALAPVRSEANDGCTALGPDCQSWGITSWAAS